MKCLIKLVVVLFIISQAKGQNAQRFFPQANLNITGIYYYPEHWKENQFLSAIDLTTFSGGLYFLSVKNSRYQKTMPFIINP